MGAADEQVAKPIAAEVTHMIMSSSTGWRPISEVPADRRDGRRILLWNEDQAVIGRWDPEREGWEDPENMSVYEDVILWADILSPKEL